MKGNNKRIIAFVLAMGFAVLILFYQSNSANPVNAADNQEKNTAVLSNSDPNVLLDKIYQKYKQTGYTEDTLASFAKVEALIFKKGAHNKLHDIKLCYNGYISNLIFLNKQKEIGSIINRWSTVFESVYQSQQDLTNDFALELELDSDNLFDTGNLLGPEYDPLLLKHMQNQADFIEKAVEADPDLPKFSLQYALGALSYALLYNQKFEDFGKTVSKMLSVKDQITGELPENIMPVAAYKYLLVGNTQKCEEIIKNVIIGLGDTKDQLYLCQRTGTNAVIDDLYQMKKRDIESKNIEKMLGELPEPILNITEVSANGPADNSGVLKGDRINKYQGVKCLSYCHFMDLIAAHAGDPKIELELIRDNKTIDLTVPGGRLGISIAEDIKK